MAAGVLSTVALNKRVQPTSHKGSVAVSAGNARAQAYLPLSLWAAVIIVGRLRSYWTEFSVQ